MNQSRYFSRLAGLIALVVFASLAAVAQTAAPRLVTQKIDEANLTTLPGHIHPEANALNDRGPVDDSAPVGHIVLLLKRSAGQQLDLDAFVDQLHNSQSENYHKWLTPADFGRRFGPADEDVAAVAAWLESKGFTIEDMPASKTHITFTGTVGQMRQAFHTDIHHLSVNGAAHQATVNEPQIPAALAAVVSGFRQLHDFGPKPANHFAGVFKKDSQTGTLTPVEGTNTAPRANFTNNYNNNNYYDVGPQDFYTIYNETPLLNNGINGAGVTIAVIEETQINQADPVSFRSQFGLPAYPSTPNSTAGGINYLYGSSSGLGGDTACTAPLTVSAGKSSGDEGEADIDVEWAGTTAPNAIIDFVACGTKSNAIGSYGTDLAAAHVANYLSSTVAAASLSYGECEVTSGNSAFYSNLWEQYAAQGQTIVVSAGDGGSLGCETLTNNTSVNVMSDSAYNISAGGTDFGDAYISDDYSTSPATTWWNTTNGAGLSSAISYIPETTWGGYCSNALFVSYLQKAGSTTFGSTYTPETVCNSSYSTKNGYTAPAGGGGGVSAYTTIPSWQSVYGVGLYSSSTTKRNQPDISLFAANGFWGHSLPYCESDLYTCNFSNATDAYELEAGGTSYVAPQIAGLMALVNQKTSERQGQANYTIYGLAAQEYGTTSTPNSANLTACSGSAQGANVGASCIFHDIAADTPSLQGGTIASQIIEPCTYARVTDCYRTKSTDTYGLSAITGASHSSTLAYYAGAGYNLATGLGSVNVANLINSWNTSGISFASTTTLSASASTVPYSTTANLTLTVTVKATGRGGKVAPAGVVEFFDGGSTSGTLLGSGSIASNCTGSGATTSCDGVATLSLASSTLTPGANKIVAYFEGDAANDAPSTSTATTVTVNNWPQTVTITSPNTGTYGTPLTLTATATSGLTTFTYTVVSGPATVSGSTLTFTGVGAVVVQATQAGNSTYASASAQQTITVSPATPTLTVAASLNPSIYGQSVTFTATISSGPAGTVTFYDSASGSPVSIGTGTISGGKATLALTTLTAGAHIIAAGWAGNADYNAVTSSSITQTVKQATTTITWAAPAAITYGTALSATQLDATATSNYGGVAGSSDPGTFAYTPALGAVLTAGSQTLSVTFTPKDTTDYTTATKTVTLTVNKATTTITWATPAAITYGTALSATQLDATATSNYGGVAGSSDPGTFAYTPAAGTVLTAGSHTLSVTFTPADTTDYTTPAAKTVTLTVSKATPTITWATPAPVPYGTALSGTQLDATVTWNVGGTLTTLAGTFTYTPVAGTVMTTIGSNTLKATFAPTDTTDYNTPAAATVTLTVTQATPVITWATPAAITYGTVLSATQLDASANVAGTFVYTPASGAVLTAGSQTLSVTFTPTNSTDYTTATDSVTLTVNQAAPVITWPTPAAITYGTALSATQLDATANVAGTFVYTPAAGTVLGAGPQTLSATFTPTDTTDYATPAAKTVTLTVNQATPVITWPTPAPITYGTALSGTQLDATANVAGTFVYTPAAGTVLTAGSQTLSVTFTPSDTTDYTTPAPKTVTLTVNQATPVITWPTPAPITYGTALSGTQLDATANVAGSFVYTPAAGTVLGAGSQQLSVTFTPTDTTDYATPAAGSVNVTVNQTPLTITASSASISYGSAVPAISPGYSGFVNGDSPASLTNVPTCSTTYTVGSAAGTYPTTCSGAVDANYSISYTVGTVTVTAASQIISFTPPVTPVNYGVPPITLSASASSGLPVTFSVLSGPGAVNGSILAITGPGTVIVAADQAGDTDYTPAAEVQQTIVVNVAPTFTELASSLNPSTYGQSVTFNALVSTGGVSPTGSITFNDASNAIDSTTVTPVQTTNLVAYSQANAAAWNSDETGSAAPTVAADSGLDPFGGTNALQMAFPAPGAGTSDSFNMVSVSGAFAGQTFTASVWLSAPSATTINLLLNEVGGSSASASNAVTVGTAWQRYSVSLSIPAADSSASSLELALVNPSGQPAATINVFGAQVENATSEGPYVATYGTAQSGYGAIASFATSTLISGSHPITAAYAGDSNDAASTSVTLTQVVNDATPTLSLASFANPSVYSNPLTFTATISNSLTGTITFYDGSTAIGTGALSGGSATLITSALTVGSHSITAAWAGNADYNAVTSSPIAQTVNQGTPTLNWPTPAPITFGMPLSATQLDATANVAGNFVYSPAAGTVLGAGSQTLSVTFTPTDMIDYATPAAKTVTLTVKPATPVIIWPTPAPIYHGNALSATQLDATANVAGTYTYSPASGTVPPAGTATLSVTLVPNDTTAYTAATASVSLTVNPVGTAMLTSPAPGSVLGTTNVSFSWTPGTAVTQYDLYLGTTGVGTSNLYNSGHITATSVTVPSLPTSGVTVYARLWSLISGTWQSADYTYTEAGMPVPAALTTPAPGSVLGTTNVSFSWTPGTAVTQYDLFLGTIGVGTSNLYNSGHITATSVTVPSLPTSGVTVYARLWSFINGAWQSADYTYTEAGTPVPAALISPAPGSVLTGSSATFEWTAGSGPVAYELWLGTIGVGTNDLYNSGSTTATSASVTGLPTNGMTVFARLYQLMNGAWQFTDYTYTEAQ